jgi:hypothetical protein
MGRVWGRALVAPVEPKLLRNSPLSVAIGDTLPAIAHMVRGLSNQQKKS